MEDLLREEDFIQQKTFNPWKRFKLFYLITLGHVLIIYCCAILGDTENTATIISCFAYFISPLLIPFIVVFGKQEFTVLNKKFLAFGLLTLNLIYSFSFLIVAIITERKIFDMDDHIMVSFQVSAFILALYVVTTPLIFILRLFVIKKIKNSK